MIQLWKMKVPWSVKGKSPRSNDLSIQNSMIQWSRDSKSNDPLVLICINRFQIKNVRYGDSGISQIYFYSIEAPQIIVTPIAYFSCSAMYIPQGNFPVWKSIADISVLLDPNRRNVINTFTESFSPIFHYFLNFYGSNNEGIVYFK